MDECTKEVERLCSGACERFTWTKTRRMKAKECVGARSSGSSVLTGITRQAPSAICQRVKWRGACKGKETYDACTINVGTAAIGLVSFGISARGRTCDMSLFWSRRTCVPMRSARGGEVTKLVATFQCRQDPRDTSSRRTSHLVNCVLAQVIATFPPHATHLAAQRRRACRRRVARRRCGCRSGRAFESKKQNKKHVGEGCPRIKRVVPSEMNTTRTSNPRDGPT